MKFRKLIAGVTAIAMAISVVSIVPQTFAKSEAAKSKVQKTAKAKATILTSGNSADVRKNPPKYVFMFIGDGMSYPQIQSASDYLGAIKDPTGENGQTTILKGGSELSMMKFPVAGSATTFDSTSFCPDSASTATSLSTGYKTHSGVINMDESKVKSYETIAEKLKKQKGFKVGIISSVNLNHATPAAYYGHQPSRNNYYELGLEMIKSKFDYFAGGALKSPTGNDKNVPQEDLYELAKKEGYKVAKTQEEAKKLKAKDGKMIIISEKLADSDSMSYDIDREASEFSLADHVQKGIEVLDNKKGFFMMVEGGKIDWACHANDAGATINDTIAFDNAVAKAVEFGNKHPNETLIIVTGDHETGGLTIGFAGTNYNTYFTNIQNQKISYARFDKDYVFNYKKNKTGFNDVMKDITAKFGLVAPENAASAAHKTLVLTDYEMATLKKAYDVTMAGGVGPKATEQDYLMYGGYEPLTVTITHLLNNKSGISFSSYSHTGLPVPVFAAGVGQEMFKGYYDNTSVYKNLASILKVK